MGCKTKGWLLLISLILALGVLGHMDEQEARRNHGGHTDEIHQF